MTTLHEALRIARSPMLRRPGKGTTIGGVVGRIISLPISWWVVMLWIGAAHHEVSARIPALGYLQVAILYMTLQALGWAVVSTVYMKLDQVTDYLKANSQ